MDSLGHPVAIVTGGASGIGLALCRQLARNGALVVIADIDLPRAQEAAVSIKQFGSMFHIPLRFNVSSIALLRLINALTLCSTTPPLQSWAIFSIPSAEHWRRVLEVNLHGVLRGSRAAYSVMKRQGAGHIVNVASITGLIPSPTMTPYSTTKWAIVGFSTALRAEAVEFGVNVTVARPGLVDTSIHERAVKRSRSRARARGSGQRLGYIRPRLPR